ncbi:MAG: hypothetical protein ABMA26_02450 [Limisphaerales bacterium]
MKRSELLLVSAVVASGLLVVIALMARRYSAAAAMTATLKVEQHSPDVDTTGWVDVDGVRHTFAASGPTNFTVSGRSLIFEIRKVAGTNDMDVTMTGPRSTLRAPRPPAWAGGWVTSPDPLNSGLRVWQPTPKQDERLHWGF